MKNRFISVFMFIVILLVGILPLFSASAQSDYSSVRVKISIGDTETEKKVSLKGTYYITESNTYVKNGTLFISNDKNSGLLTVLHSSDNNENNAVTVFEGSNMCNIQRVNPDIDAGYFSLYNTYHTLTLNYLGNLRIQTYKTSAGHHLRLINIIALREYLYGVVPNEMPEYYPLEALKAQAIVSKGFTCYKIDLASASSIYDTRDTAQDQVYEGYKPTLVKSIAAVDATIDQSLYLNGKLFPTYYSQSNGGETVLPKEAWGNPTSYDAAYDKTADPYDIQCSESRAETAFFPKENTSKYLTENSTPKNDGMWYSSYSKINSFLLTYTRQALVSAGILTLDAAVTKINSISSMYSTDADGNTSSVDHVYAHVTLNASVTADSLVMQNQLKSGFVSLSEPVSLKNEVYKSIALKETDSERETKDITFSFSFKLEDLYTLKVMTRTSLRIYNVQEVDGGYAVYHRRFGHGVGLSQSSAQVMAGEKYNMDYKEILNFFFPGAKLDSFDAGTMPAFTPPPTVTPTHTPQSEYVLDSKNKTLTGVNAKLTPDEFFAPIVGAQLISLGSDGAKYIGTNSVVSIDGVEYRVVLFGDTNGDGLINVADATLLMHHIVGLSVLEGAYKLASDIDASASLNVYDATLISQAIVGAYEIKTTH